MIVEYEERRRGIYALFSPDFQEEALVESMASLFGALARDERESVSYISRSDWRAEDSERDERLWGESIPQIAYAWDVSKMDLRSKTLIDDVQPALRVCCPSEICYDIEKSLLRLLRINFGALAGL